MEMNTHAPSALVVLVSLALAVLAMVCYFVVTPDNIHIPFWLAIMAYVVVGVGVMAKTGSP